MTQRTVEAILADWREAEAAAEREPAQASPDLAARIDALRSEHAAAMDARSATADELAGRHGSPTRDTEASRQHALQHLERAMASVRNALATSQAMLDARLGDPRVNEQRIIDAETELAMLQQEHDALERGDLAALADAATTMPPRGLERARTDETLPRSR